MSISPVGASFPTAPDDPADIYKRMSRDALGDALIKAIESNNFPEATTILSSGCELSPFDLGKALLMAIEKKNDPLIKELLTRPIRGDFFPEALTCALECSSPFANEIWEIIKKEQITDSFEMGRALCAAILCDSPLAVELMDRPDITPYMRGLAFAAAVEKSPLIRDLIWDSGKAMNPRTLGKAFRQALLYNPAWAIKIFQSKHAIDSDELGESLPIAICNHFSLIRELWDSFKPGYNQYSRGPQYVANALVAALEHDPPLVPTLYSWIRTHVRRQDLKIARILSTAIRVGSTFLAEPLYREYFELTAEFRMSSRELVDVLIEAIKCDFPLTTHLITSELEMDPVPLGDALVLCWRTGRLDVARLLIAHRTIAPRSVGEVFLAARESGNPLAQEILDSSQAVPCSILKKFL